MVCLNTASLLKNSVLEKDVAELYETITLRSIHNVMRYTNFSMADAKLLLSSLPLILLIQSPVVKDILNTAIDIIPKMMDVIRNNISGYDFKPWLEYYNLYELLDMLKVFDKSNP